MGARSVHRTIRSIAALLCLGALLAAPLGCSRPQPRPAAGPERSVSSPQAGAPLVLEAACSPAKSGGRDELLLEVTLTNVGPKSLYVSRTLRPPQRLELRFADAAGKEVEYGGVVAQLARLVDKDDFINLAPGDMYGARVRLVRQTRGQYAGYYEIVFLPDERLTGYYRFRGPGRYSLTAEFWGADGELAHVPAWTGRVHSDKIWFEIPRS